MDACDRALRALSAGRACLIHARDEASLRSGLCGAVVDAGGYSAAWICDREAPEQAGPPGARARVTIPLHTTDDEVIGHLIVVADDPGAFDEKASSLLGGLAFDVAVIIARLRAPKSDSRAEHSLLRSERALRTLSAGNRTLLRAADEEQLLHEMCRVIVEHGGYAAAGVVYAEHDDQKTLRPMALVGWPAELVHAHHLTWADTTPGQLAVGIAVRTGMPAVARHIQSDPAYAKYREGLAALGIGSNGGLPLRIGNEVIGCMSIGAVEPDAFADDELTLLSELADDLSYGIATLRLRARHRVAEQAVERMAYYDPLTALPNRMSLHEKCGSHITESRQRRWPLALLVLKVGQFQEINDTLGFQEGDALVREVAQRLRQFMSQSEFVARIGEDELAVLLPRAGAEQAEQVASRLVTALGAPVELPDGLFVNAHVCVGIALFPGHGADPDALIRRANVAALQARRSGSGCAVYSGSVDRECASRLALLADLRRAIEGNELLLYCQPKVRMGTMKVCGAEALVRWHHPEHGMIPTGEFIKLAENSGLITSLTHWVLEAAFRQSYDWGEGGVDCPLSVNLSAHDLRDPRLLDHIRGLFSTWGTPAHAIEFEITESALMEDPAGALYTLTRLKDLGVELYIDDFGIGYSSLGYLQKLPIDSIKIDQSFVSGMLTNNDSAIIVRSTIDLGHNLKRTVVAEGVESQAVWERLTELQCDAAQGYFVGEPMPTEQFRDWQQRSHWARAV